MGNCVVPAMMSLFGICMGIERFASGQLNVAVLVVIFLSGAFAAEAYIKAVAHLRKDRR